MSSPRDLLSPKQIATLDLLLEGLSERQVALQLEVSQHTVHSYVKAIYRAHGVNARSELLALYVQDKAIAAGHSAAGTEASVRIGRLEVEHLVADRFSGGSPNSSRTAAIGGTAAGALVIGVFLLTGTTFAPDHSRFDPSRDLPPGVTLTAAAPAPQYGATVTSSLLPGDWTPIDRLTIGRRYRIATTAPVRLREEILVRDHDGVGNYLSVGGVLQAQPKGDEACLIEVIDLGPSGLPPRDVEGLGTISVDPTRDALP